MVIFVINIMKFVINFAVVDVKTLKINIVYVYMTHTAWMSILKNKKLYEVVLPGTHDSGAFNVIKTPLKWFVRKWTETQDKTIKEQLDLGIRAFDFRIAFRDNNVYLSHRYMCCLYYEQLEIIKEFIKNNPSEFIVIRMKPDFDHKESITNDIESDILFKTVQILNTLIYSNEFKYGQIYYNDLIRTDKRIIFFYEYRNKPIITYGLFRPIGFAEYWLNKTDVESWTQEYNKIKYLDRNSCNAIDVVLTPTFSFILRYYFCKSLKSMAQEMSSFKINFPKENDKLLWNIVYLDFPTEEQVANIINSNYKLK